MQYGIDTLVAFGSAQNESLHILRSCAQTISDVRLLLFNFAERLIIEQNEMTIIARSQLSY